MKNQICRYIQKPHMNLGQQNQGDKTRNCFRVSSKVEYRDRNRLAVKKLGAIGDHICRFDCSRSQRKDPFVQRMVRPVRYYFFHQNRDRVS